MIAARVHPNTRLVFALAGVVAVMVALSYAAVPLYRIFCQVTGFGGTTQRAEASAAPAITDRAIKVRFVASTHRDMPVRFRPLQTSQTVKVGERSVAFFQVENPTRQAITGVATFNVTPNKAGPYFAKIECFCFNEQRLEPGVVVDMPVAYFVDPLVGEDENMDGVGEITLSYTFFESSKAPDF